MNPTREEIREDVARVVGELGGPPSTREYQEHGSYATETVKHRFSDDGWEAILQVLGYDYTPREQVAETVLKEDIERVRTIVGSVPTTHEYREHGEYSTATIVTRLGGSSWEETLQKLGYDYTSNYQVADAVLEEDVERVKKIVGSAPTTHEYREHGEYALQTIVARFGDSSWEGTMQALGYDYTKKWPIPEEHLRVDVERVVEKLNGVPSRQQYSEHGDYAAPTLAKRFGDGVWKKAMETLGYNYHGNPPTRTPDSELP